MAEDVLEKLSSVIGRKVEPVAKPAVQPKASAPEQQNQSQPKSLESIIGRPLTPVKLPDMAGSRFGLYSKARQNGFDSKRAVGVAMQQAGLARAASAPTTWEKFQTTLSNVPVEPGKTVGDIGRDLGRIGQRANNPFMMSDEQWDKEKQAHKEFFEKHIGKNFAAGAAQGALEFGEEFTSPVQVALAFGTFGESVLARAAMKTGIKGAVPAARVLSKLVQAQFATQMIEGTAQGAIGTYQAIQDGDWEKAGQMAVESLASGLMAKGIIHHEDAIGRVRGDLEKVAREKYGVPEGKGVGAMLTNRFDQLDPYRQGEVIAETVKRSPEYQATLQKAEGQDQQAKERTQKQQTRRLNDYYGQAMEQAWNPNVAQRTIRRLQDSRVRGQRIDFERFKKRVESEEREAYSARARELDEEQWQARQAGRQAVRDERPGKRQQAAEGRAQQTQAARDLSATREGIFAQRQKADELPIEGALPQRQVEAVLTEKGLAYPAVFWGEPNYFGVEPEEAGHAVYRQTPRGLEWMGTDGNFTSDPEEKFHSHDPETADTLARITSFKANADNAAEAEGATEEQDNEAKILRQIRDDLVEGSISARDAQRKAGIAEKIKLGDQFDAAREGKLNGPFHESSPHEYAENVEREMRKGKAKEVPSPSPLDSIEYRRLKMQYDLLWDQISERSKRVNRGEEVGDDSAIREKIDEIRAQMSPYEKRAVRQETQRRQDILSQYPENELTEDELGILHPERSKEFKGDQQLDIPHIRDYEKRQSEPDTEIEVDLGELASLARQQTESNLNHIFRPGDYIVSKRGVKWTLDSKGMLHPDDGGAPVPLMKRGVYSNQALQLAGSGRVGYGTRTREQRRAENSKRNDVAKAIREQQEKVDQEMRLAVQREGLETAPEAAPRADIEEKGGRAPKWLEKPPAAPGTEALRKIGKLILKAPGDENSVIQSIARANNQSPEEVMRIALANDPERANTTEQKVAKLEVGDRISDDFRKDRPWVVEEKRGKLWLRSGQANPIELDRLNPSERVRQLVERGEITSDSPEFTQDDARKAAFDAPHVIRQKQAVEAIRERMEGRKDPEPKTQQQAQVQAKVAEQRAADAQSAATTAVIEAIDPKTDNVEQAINDVDKAQQQVKIAEEGYAQEAEAKAKTIPEDQFEQRAPASIGYKGSAGTMVQNNREFQFHYEVLPIEAIQTSHVWNGNTLEVNPDYPKSLQPRTISQRQSDKNALKAQPGKYDFRQYGDKGISGAMGPVIVDGGGRGVGGNTRIAIMRKHLENIDKIGDPEERAAAMAGFNAAMRKLAEESGVPGYPNDGKTYVVVRMLDKPVETTREAAELGRLFNKKIGEEITKSAKGVSYSKAFDEPLLEDIGRRVEANEGIIAAMQADPEFFKDIIENRFGITEEEEVDWFKEVGEGEQKRLVLNDDGRDQFIKALLGTVVKDTSILNRIEGKTPYRALERGLSYILKMKALPDRDITGKILEALQASADTIGTDPNLHASKDKWSATYNPQQAELAGMETETPAEPDRVVEALYRALNASDAAVPRVFNDRLKSFIGEETSKGGWMFGEHQETPAEAFNRAFGKELREVAHTRGDSHEQLSDEEFNAALRNRELSDVERDEATNPEHKEDRAQTPEQPVGGSKGSLAEHETTPEEYAQYRKNLAARGITPETAGDKWGEYIAEEEKKNLAATPKFGPPPQPAPAIAEPPKSASPEKKLAEAKTDQGYVTPNQLLDFLQHDPATAHAAHELFRHAQLVAEHVWKYDHPAGVEKKDALAWILKDRVGALGRDDSETAHRGRYSDPLIEKGFGDRTLKLFKSADASTFIHEFFHVIFPYLSDEDLHAIDSIGGKKVWDGKRSSLRGDVYTKLSEKLSGGGERFLRDENPTGFTSEVKAVLTKLKAIMRDIYVNALKDPLSMFKNSEESREVFSKMFHIADFDVADTWKKQVDKARAAKEKASKEPSNPLVKLKNELGAKTAQESLKGDIDDTIGDYVSPVRTVTFLYDSKEDAIAAATEGINAGKIKGAEIVKGDAGVWGLRFNTKENLPSALNQPAIEEPGDLGVRLEKLEAKLKSTPPYQMMQRKLLELQIRNLKNEIRSNHGVEERKPESNPELAKAALQEVKDARAEGTNRVRENANAIPRPPQPESPRGIPRPPKLGMPYDAAPGGKRVGAGAKPAPRVPASLEDVRPVSLEPLPKERGVPRGTIEGEAFDSKAWTEGLKRAGMPENVPPPTVSLDRTTAEKLKYPAQKQVVQTALSAFEQGDGIVIGTPPGTGKSYTSSGLIKEFQRRNPNARILYVTKNAGLKEKTKNVAANVFGFNIDSEKPKDVAQTGVWSVSYRGMIDDTIYKQMKWDLVVADEAGEARNWFKPANKQGKMLMEVIRNSKKAAYLSATPFHSPSEYGYLEKLGLWKDGKFEQWIGENFKHKDIDGKIVAELDPGKQAKLRQQLIERGQFVSQAISYDGYSAHLAVVPVTDQMKRGLDRIREGFARARAEFLKMGKKGVAEKASAFEAVYTKMFLERERLPQAIEMARKGREQGWHVGIFSEHTAEDLFRREREEGEDASTYQELDDAMGGQLSKIIPPFPSVYGKLREAFGADIGDYSGAGNTDRERTEAIEAFLKGDLPMLYTTYAAGGIGVDMHDADYPEKGIKGGDKPRLFIYLGPPYSGVLLEQAMGRPWRFGVKSDVMAVFLASDSEPDIRLMTQKVAPRMRALRAAVLGEKDSLASAMATYTDEEKVKARQDALAYAEGNEMKVDANSFTVRSKKRDVGVQDWSAIQFPSAEHAKNKGMKYGEDVPGGDWSTLYQAKFDPPPSTGEAKTEEAINDVAASAAKNPEIPHADIAMGAAKAVEVSSVAPEGIDKAIAGKKAMEAALAGNGFSYDPETGNWKAPHGIVARQLGDDISQIDPREKKFKRYPLGTLGMGFDQRAISAGRKIGAERQVRDVLNLTSDYYQANEGYNGPLVLDLVDIFNDAKIDVHPHPIMDKIGGFFGHKPKDLVREVVDVLEGRRASADERVNKAAAAFSKYYDAERDLMASKGVHRADGGTFRDVKKNPQYFPHFTDWEMELEDPETGEKKKLREITDDTDLNESAKLKYFERMRQELGADVNTVKQWLQAVNEDRRRSINPPLNGTVTQPRLLNHPFYHKDFWAFIKHAKEVSSALALEETFGHDMGRLDEALKKVPNRQLRTDLKSSIATTFEHQDWSTRVGQLVRAGQGVEAITKMTLSPLSVATHQIHALMGLKMGLRGLKYQAMANYNFIRHPHEFMREKYYMGVVSMKQNPYLLEGTRRGLAGKYFDLSGFSGLYRWTRAIVGDTAGQWMDQDALSDLKKGGKRAEEARRLLKNTMLIGDLAIDRALASGKWDEDSLGRAERAFTDKIAFSENPNQMPRTARMSMAEGLTDAEKNWHAAARGMYMLQSFSIKAYSLLKENLYDEVVVHHNLKPLAPFLLLYPIAGAALMGAKAGVTGGFHRAGEKAKGKKHEHDRWDTFMDEFRDIEKHPWAGALKFYLDSLCTVTGMERTKRWADIGMMTAMGNKEKVANMARYFATDETEQGVGGLYSDLFWVAETQGQGIYDYLHTKHEISKWPAFMRDEARELEQLIPFVKVIPKVEETAHPGKKTSHGPARF